MSPSHFPTAVPAPAKVERVMMKGRRLGLLANMAARDCVDITAAV
jgi:hypothetical protein